MSISQAEGEHCLKESGSRVESSQASSVGVVTVTYGERQHLLRQVLVALLKENAIRNIVVVNNGAPWNVQKLSEELGPGRIEVVNLGTNRGSAAGFAAGIQRACELKTDFIWLLDDDNVPEEDALAELLDAYAYLRNNFSDDALAVVASRKSFFGGGGIPRRYRPSSFLYFHVLDVPHKFWCRTPWGRPRLRGPLPALVEITYGVYGGLLFHRAAVEAHGLPREDFVVYVDDTEFVYRITRKGGALWLVNSAKITDLEANWGGAVQTFKDSFHFWLQPGSDMRVFYSIRNHAYFDSHCLPRNRLMYWLNRKVYCFALWCAALALRRMDRYRLLQNAIRDGLAGRLGMLPRFPLK